VSLARSGFDPAGQAAMRIAPPHISRLSEKIQMNAKLLTLAFAAACIAAPAAAQQDRQPAPVCVAGQQSQPGGCMPEAQAGAMRHPMPPGMRMGEGMMGPAESPVSMLLMHRADLGLNADQVSRLQALDARARAEHQRMAETMRAAGPPQWDAQDEAAFRATLERQSRAETDMAVAQFRMMRDVHAILTADQLRKVADMHHEMMAMHGPGMEMRGGPGMEMHGGPGMPPRPMDGGHDGHDGQMSDCSRCCAEMMRAQQQGGAPHPQQEQ
jgi:hypothetical protein